jgi:hypothetical protein
VVACWGGPQRPSGDQSFPHSMRGGREGENDGGEMLTSSMAVGPGSETGDGALACRSTQPSEVLEIACIGDARRPGEMSFCELSSQLMFRPQRGRRRAASSGIPEGASGIGNLCCWPEMMRNLGCHVGHGTQWGGTKRKASGRVAEDVHKMRWKRTLWRATRSLPARRAALSMARLASRGRPPMVVVQ